MCIGNWQGVTVKDGGEPYTYVTEGGEKYEVHAVTFKFGKKVEVSLEAPFSRSINCP